MIILYGLCDPTTHELRYIGQTSRNIKHRYAQHLYANNKSKLCQWIKGLLYQGLKPEIFELEKVPVIEWEFWEIWWIAYWRSLGASLLNTSKGGLRVKSGWKHTEESKKIMSLKLKGRIISDYSRKLQSIATKNKPKSMEMRRRLSASKMGIPCPDHVRKKLSEYRKGRKHSDETLIKMSQAKKRFVMSLSDEERYEKYSSMKKGKKCSVQTKQKIALARTGKKYPRKIKDYARVVGAR